MSGIELVGVAAAGLQFIEVAGKAAKLCKAIYDQVKNAPAEIQAHRGELETLTRIVAGFESNNVHQSEEVEKTLSACMAHIQALLRIFEEISWQPTDSGLKKTWKASGGLAKQDDILELFSKIERNKTSLLLAMS